MRPRAAADGYTKDERAVVGASATGVIDEGGARLATAVAECSDGRHGSMLG